MTEPISRKPLIPYGWLRALLFCIFFYVIILLLSIPIAILVLLLKKDDIQKGVVPDVPSLLKGEFFWLITVATLIASLVTVFLFRKFVDRKTFASLGFKTQGYGNDALAGFFLPLTILGIGSLILFASGHLQWVDIDIEGNNLFISLGILIMVAFAEEIVFRGYILNNLMGSFNKWVALVISALLFALMHISNDGYNLFAFLTVFLGGILIGLNYVYTKNLWFAILFHFGWNFFEGPVLGYKVSGINLPSVLQPELNGDELLTGGNFGFEGSIFAVALTLMAILILYLVYERKKSSDTGLLTTDTRQPASA